MYSFTILVAGVCYIAAAQAKCDAGCDVPVQHYEELGCEAVFAKTDDCCPSHYNCAKIEGRAADKCYFKGKTYNKGDKIDYELTIRHCAASCYCAKGDREDITCANVECPELFGGIPFQPGCFRITEGNACCSTKTVCPPLDKLATCEVNGKTYYEGQSFDPGSEKCISCTCKPGFEGKFVEPFCTPLNCGIELRNAKKAKNNCAPVYYGAGRCCPIQWQCSDEAHTIEKATEPSASDKQCQFGATKLNIGDKVIPTPYSEHSPEIICECRVPPLLTCIQTPHPEPPRAKVEVVPRLG